MNEYTEAGWTQIDIDCAQYLEKALLTELGEDVFVVPIETPALRHFRCDNEMMEFDPPHFF